MSRKSKHDYRWANYSDDKLLSLRFCDLHLSLRTSSLAPSIERLYGELAARGLRFRPHVWLADEWFSPDGIPGFAIPFYLAHPRLARLERKMMHEVEGGNHNWQMRILRHETGHAIDTAYRIRRRKDWREVFGKASLPYPKSYRPKPTSTRYVLHLGHWYAQTHPTEDFAETFATWLQPRARWQRMYEGWPALDKLEYVDGLMHELKTCKPVVSSREIIEPLSENTRTLGEFYRREVARYAVETTTAYDDRLLKVFSTRKVGNQPSAVKIIRKVRPSLTDRLVQQDGLHAYLVHNVVRMIIDRCRLLDLFVRPVASGAKNKYELQVHRTMEYIVFDMLYRRRQQYIL